MDKLKINTLIFYYSKIGWIGLFVTSVVLTWQKYGLNFPDILLCHVSFKVNEVANSEIRASAISLNSSIGWEFISYLH